MKFYNELFCKCCEEKGTVENDHRITIRMLYDYVKDKTRKVITADNMRKTYIKELHNNGVIEEYEIEDPETGKVKREKQYSPLIVIAPVQTTQQESGSSRLIPTDYALRVSNKHINYVDLLDEHCDNKKERISKEF